MLSQATYSPELDGERLECQAKRLMSHADGVWRTLKEWADITHGSEAGTSARLRELDRVHGYKKERKRVVGGLWIYRILPPFKFDDSGQGAFL